MLAVPEKLLLVKLLQVTISTGLSALAQDYKLEAPNINIRFWQTPLRESVYQSIARHRVYRGENLDERQEYDRMLWGKIRVARFMKRLDVSEATEGLRTGVLVYGKRGDFEFRQTDHSIYDCVGRKCRSDNVLLAVWRVQQMNEPFTLYISVKVPNFLYHFEPTEDIYLYTVEKGLKRLRYQQYSTKKSTGKLIYDPYPFVSSRLTTQSSPLNPTTLEVTTVSPEVKVPLTTYNKDENLKGEGDSGRDEITSPAGVKEYSLVYYQNPELTTPLIPDLDQSLIDYNKGSGIRRTFNTFLDTNPYWQLDLLSPPSQYKNYSDDKKQGSGSKFDSPRDSVFTPNQPTEVLITPKPFKPSQQFFTFSEPDPLYSNTESEKPRYTTERLVMILSPLETKKESQKVAKPQKTIPFSVEDATISLENEVKLATSAPKIQARQDKKPQRRLSTQRGSSGVKTRAQIKKRTRIRSYKVKKDKTPATTELKETKIVPTDSYVPELKNRYLSPTTYHPKLNILELSESKQLYSHLRPVREDVKEAGRQSENEGYAKSDSRRARGGKITKRQETEGYFSNGHVGYDVGGTDRPEYQTTLREFSDYEKWGEGGQYNNTWPDTQAGDVDYFNRTQGFQDFYGATGYEGSIGTTGYEGSIGTTGYEGSIGTTGYEGSIGTTGDEGSIGTTGYEGSIGTTGYEESFGTTGYEESDYTTGYEETGTEVPNYGSENTETQWQGRSNEPKESPKREAIVKDDLLGRNSLPSFKDGTQDKNLTEKSSRLNDEKLGRENAVVDEKLSAGLNETSGNKVDTGSGNGTKVADEGKNSTVSVIVSRLTKSVTELRHNGTEAVHKRNAPVYRKKILKKLKALKSNEDSITE